MSSKRTDLTLIADILGVLDRHGYARHDTEHTGRAILLIRDLARIYEGTLDHPSGPYINQPSSPAAPAGPSGPGSRHAVIVPRSDLTTVFIALDIAADYERDRAELCNCCADQSCPDCHTHQRRAEAYDQVADRLHRYAESALDAHRGQPGPPQPSSPAADKEAGQ